MNAAVISTEHALGIKRMDSSFKQLTVETICLIGEWIYHNQFEFANKWGDFTSGDTTTATYKERMAELGLLQKEKAKMAKQMKNAFPEVRSYNAVYDKLLGYVTAQIQYWFWIEPTQTEEDEV